MKKNILIILTTIFLVGCNSSTSISTLSKNPTTNPATEMSDEEIKNYVLDNLMNKNYFIKGETHYITYYIPDANHPENKTIQSQSTTGKYLTGISSDFYYFVDESRSNNRVFKYEKDQYGNAYQLLLNPLTNQVEKVYARDVTGKNVRFNDIFFNPFALENVSKAFTYKDGCLTLNNLDAFDHEAMARLLTNQTGADYNEFIITLNEKHEPTDFVARTYDGGKYSATERNYIGRFIDENEANVRGDPISYEHVSAHDDLKVFFDKLINQNYTINYTVTYASKTSHCTFYLKEDSYLYEYDDSFTNMNNKGAYYVEGRGLTYFEKINEHYEETKLPYLLHNSKEEFLLFWRFAPESFAYENGVFKLHEAYNYYSYVLDYLLPDNKAIGYTQVTDGTLEFRIDNDDLIYTYQNNDFSVEATISNIGKTSLPIDIADIVPYVEKTTMSEFAHKLDERRGGDIFNRLCLFTNGNVDLIPYVDTQYDYLVRIDCFGSNATGLLYFTGNANFMFELEAEEEATSVYNRYLAKLNGNDVYQYNEETGKYEIHIDDVNLEISLSLDEGKNGFAYAITLNVFNLNEWPTL